MSKMYEIDLAGFNAGSVLVGIAILILFGALAFALIKTTTPSQSKRYRSYLTNLYVSSKVRELAKKDSLDLDKEALLFTKYISLSNKQRIQDLDDAIEQELMDRIEKDKETTE